MSFTYGILYKVLGVILCTFIHGDLLKPCDNQPARDMSLFQLTSVEAGAVAIYWCFLISACICTTWGSCEPAGLGSGPRFCVSHRFLSSEVLSDTLLLPGKAEGSTWNLQQHQVQGSAFLFSVLSPESTAGNRVCGL